ncbi:hypothetical protein GCM10023200_12890 [Actinomycetospora chlora]|uniref:Integral membrane protein n=2 Tax=Actinomycetospora chlora TaxID=663608 RepID=A0ABP9AGM8_9PSEU
MVAWGVIGAFVVAAGGVPGGPRGWLAIGPFLLVWVAWAAVVWLSRARSSLPRPEEPTVVDAVRAVGRGESIADPDLLAAALDRHRRAHRLLDLQVVGWSGGGWVFATWIADPERALPPALTVVLVGLAAAAVLAAAVVHARVGRALGRLDALASVTAPSGRE